MKRAILIFGIIMASCIQAIANQPSTPVETLSKKEVRQLSPDASKARVLVLTQRLEYLSSLDPKSLDRAERSALRHEVRDIEKELKAHNVGIYISGSALLIIILLIILL